MNLNCCSCHTSIPRKRRGNHKPQTTNQTAPINNCLSMVVWSPTLIGLDQNGCWTFQGSQLPWALPFIFLLCCPLNDHRRKSHSFFKIGRLFFCYLLCAGQVTWQGKSVQCCTCSKWVHLRCSQLSRSKFKILGSSHS